MRRLPCPTLALVVLSLLPAPTPAEEKSEVRDQATLKIKGNQLPDGGGFEITEVDADGPAANMKWANGKEGRVILEKGDVIVQIEGKRFRSTREMLDLLNDGYAANNGQVRLRVLDATTKKPGN